MGKLAINGGKPVIKKEFPEWPIRGGDELKAVQDVIKSGEWEWRGGTRCREFAKEFAKFQHVDFALPVANGSVAIEAALEALGVGDGDEVIVPDYTFMATAVSPIRRGAKVVLVDVAPDTFCINPDLIEKAVTDKTKAIIPVHFGGHPCDMKRIMRIADKYKLYVIEDCAHAHGAIWERKYAGTFGDISTFSFQASKTLTCGEGGAIVTNNERFMSRCRSLHDAGRKTGRSVYNHYLSGTNYRMNELQVALLLAQMTRLREQCEKRDHNGKLLTNLLSQIKGIKPQARDNRVTRHGHYLFTFILEADIPREIFKKALAAEGVLVQLEYPAVHTLEFMKKSGMNKGEFPVSDLLAARSVWLCHQMLLAGEKEVSLIAEAIHKVIENKNELKEFTK